MCGALTATNKVVKPLMLVVVSTIYKQFWAIDRQVRLLPALHFFVKEYINEMEADYMELLTLLLVYII